MYYHFIGIGGIGMGTLASLLLAKGHKVSGSDLKENDLIASLRKAGASITIGHHASNVKFPDFVVYSSAVRINNPELIEAESKSIPVLKRASVLAQLVNSQTGITVAGAHGKTTTTSMVSLMLIKAQLNPTTAVGGVTAYHSQLGEGKYFVAEVDESDGTFLYFNPTYSIITNIDFEHVDFYKNWEGILGAYKQFIQRNQDSGCTIICGEDKRLQQLSLTANKKILRYGFQANFDVYARNIETKGYEVLFEAFSPSGKIGNFKLSVPGEHNVLNALACITLGLVLEVPLDVMQDALASFTGVKRRFQQKGNVDGVMVVDDYGHHPTEIVATLNAARSFNPQRLITVFQPHRYSRTKFLLEEFVASLKNTDHLLLTDIYAASEKVTEGVATNVLLSKLQEQYGQKVSYAKKEEILNELQKMVQPGDLVLFLGAGDIYHLSDDLVKRLEQKKVGV